MNSSPDVSIPEHGGDIGALIERYGNDPPWLDFSANINPLGPPASVRTALHQAIEDPTALVEYPTSRERLLRSALAKHHGLSAENIVIANGSAALIEAFIRTIAPRRCLLPQPAFSEYERALEAQPTEVLPFHLDPVRDFVIDPALLLQALQRQRPDVLILTNPHNPSGALMPLNIMREIVAQCRRLNIALLLDEAFIDYAPEASLLSDNDAMYLNDTIFVIRSLTKFYAMPGLRVGYGIATPSFAAQLTSRIPSWPITSVAIDAAIVALQDHTYPEITRTENIRERTTLSAALTDLGFRVLPSSANFLLIETNSPSSALTALLAERFHIAVRDCSSYKIEQRGFYIRISVKSALDNVRLIDALQVLL
jgi:threonine-phosphate decarboxylase